MDGYEFIDFWLSIEGVGLNARTLVRTIEGGTGPYCLTQWVQELADDWKGENPSREFESIEHHFSLASLTRFSRARDSAIHTSGELPR